MPDLNYIDEGEDGMLDAILASAQEAIQTRKGGAGSGSWEAPGQPRFAWAPKSAEELKSKLGSGIKMMLSAERGNLSPEENARRTANLQQSLELLADDIIPQQGVYGGTKEQSFVVSVKSQEQADKIRDIAFRVLDQDSVIQIDGGKAELRYRDGKKEVGNVSDLEVDPAATDNYSTLGGMKYRIPFKEQRNA